MCEGTFFYGMGIFKCYAMSRIDGSSRDVGIGPEPSTRRGQKEHLSCFLLNRMLLTIVYSPYSLNTTLQLTAAEPVVLHRAGPSKMGNLCRTRVGVFNRAWINE